MTVLSLSSMALGNRQHPSRSSFGGTPSSAAEHLSALLLELPEVPQRCCAELSWSANRAPLKLCHQWRGSDTHPAECRSAAILSGGYVLRWEVESEGH
jgi:hypothetical protein